MGRTILPERVQATAKAAIRAIALAAALQRKREVTAARAISLGKPTETSHGALWAMEEPVMRETPSDQVTTCLDSPALMWRTTLSNWLISRPTQLGPFALCAITSPFSATIVTTVPGGR